MANITGYLSMKQLKHTILLTVLMSMVGVKAFAYDIAVENDDGVTIFYNYINSGTELEVTYEGRNEWGWYGYNRYSKIIIPEEVVYMGRTRKVTGIGEDSFRGRYNIKEMTIPNSVTYIGSHAFVSCGFTSITIPSSVTSIGEDAFWNTTELSKVIVKDIAAWCAINFENDEANPLYAVHSNVYPVDYYDRHLYSDEYTEIKDLMIPNTVTNIGKYAFTHCFALTSVTIGNNVTSIGREAFFGCKNLTSVKIGNSVTSIGENTFNNCSGLTSITIPNSVTSIGGSSFAGTGLTSITIPNSVTRIDYSAFQNCNNLFTIVSLIENPFNIDGASFISSVFDKDVFYNATLYVPIGTIDKYKSTEGWKDFIWIEEGVPAGINDIKQETTTVSRYYNLNGQETSQPRKGINIVKMSDGKTKKIITK